MTKDEGKQPAQVPGDAESPPQGKTDRTVQEAIRHSDKTEPIPSAQKQPAR